MPSGLDEKIIGENTDYVKTKLLGIEEYERLVNDEVEVGFIQSKKLFKF